MIQILIWFWFSMWPLHTNPAAKPCKSYAPMQLPLRGILNQRLTEQGVTWLPEINYKGSSMRMQVFGTGNCKKNCWMDMATWLRNTKAWGAWVCRTVPLQNAVSGYSVRMPVWKYIPARPNNKTISGHGNYVLLNLAQSLPEPYIPNVDIEDQQGLYIWI